MIHTVFPFARGPVSALVLVLALLNAAPVVAKPMMTPLKTVLAQTQTMVIARFRGPVGQAKLFRASHFWLDVEQSLVGKVSKGRLRVARGDGAPSVALGARVVALIDGAGRWRWVGRPVRKGLSLERGVLKLSGFYDFNAHVVYPGVATLSGLRALKAGRPLTIRVSGPVKVLAKGQTKAVDSGIVLHVDGSWDVKRGYRMRVRGLPKGTRGFPKAQVSLSSWNGQLAIRYRGSWPRPLQFAGDLGAVDPKTGRLQATFRVTQPDLVTKALLTRYLARSTAAYQIWRYRIRLADGKTWRASDGHDYGGNFYVTTPKGRFGYSTFHFAKHDKKREVRLRTGGKPLVIRFARQTAKAQLDVRGTMRQLHQEIVQGPIGCRVVSGAKRQRCTLSLQRVELKPAIRAP
jgi:hypothetical protein